MGSNPWNIYAEQLFPLGHGHPLWFPEPVDGYEVSLGDVGRLDKGRFCTLFNSMQDMTDKMNTVRRPASTDCQRLGNANTTGSLITPERIKITQNVVFSHNIHISARQWVFHGGDHNFTIPGSVGGSFTFQSTGSSGALLMLAHPGHSVNIRSKRDIVHYIKDNFDSWMELAKSNGDESLGVDFKEDELIFVCGTTKASEWGVAAFQSDIYREKDGNVFADFAYYTRPHFSVTVSRDSLPKTHCRSGSLRGWNTPGMPMALGGVVAPGSPLHDQCIFIHYYKVRRRCWLFKQPILAGAGPHQLPPGPHNPGPATVMNDSDTGRSSMYEAEPEWLRAQEQTYDPVNDLLEYILRVSAARVAIASDLDVTAIFHGEEFPQDIPTALVRVVPPVEVDEHGVGTVNVGHRFEQVQRPREEGISKEVPAHVQDSCDDPIDPAVGMRSACSEPGGLVLDLRREAAPMVEFEIRDAMRSRKPGDRARALFDAARCSAPSPPAPCPVRFCSHLCLARAARTHAFVCVSRNPASAPLPHFAHKKWWMGLDSAFAQCTTRALLASQGDEKEFEED